MDRRMKTSEREGGREGEMTEQHNENGPVFVCMRVCVCAERR